MARLDAARGSKRTRNSRRSRSARTPGIAQHAAQFLRMAGITVEGERASVAMRAARATRWPSLRPLGVTLQPRRALAAMQEVLEGPAPPPPLRPSSARPLPGFERCGRSLRGPRGWPASFQYVPAVLVKHFADSGALERHFCVLDDETFGVREFAGALVRLAAASARRHVVVRFRRLRSERGMIVLEPMSVRTLMGMVFAEPGAGPTEQELFDAARLAEGRPGAFLAQLTLAGCTDMTSRFVVHETAPDYEVGPQELRVPVGEEPPRRMLRTALHAKDHAAALAARGRHAAAARQLLRAARVLAGRGRREESAICLIQAGGLALDRGRTGDAAALFEKARAASGGGSGALEAATRLCRSLDLRSEAPRSRGSSARHAGGRGSAAGSERRHLRDCDARPLPQSSGALFGSHRGRGNARLARRGSPRDRHARGRRTGPRGPRSNCGGHSTGPSCRSAGGNVLCRGTSHGRPGVGGSARVRRGHNRHGRHPSTRSGPSATGASAACPHPGAASRVRSRHHVSRPVLAAVTCPDPVTPATGCTASGSTPRSQRWRRSGPVTAQPNHALDLRNESAETLEALLRACHAAQDDRLALSAICTAAIERLRASTVMLVAREDRAVLATGGRTWSSSSSILAQTFADRPALYRPTLMSSRARRLSRSATATK